MSCTVSLNGSIETMSVFELCAWLGRRKHTGVLSFSSGNRRKTLNIAAGRVISAASSDPREFFGQFLINFGLLSEDDLQRAFETQRETKVLLGKILVMTGHLSEEQVLRMLELKIRETVLDAFLWDKGAFTFEPKTQSVGSAIEITIQLEQLSMEGNNRRNKFREIRQVIKDNSVHFRARAEPSAAAPDRLTPAGVVFDLARGGLSVADIVLRFHSTDYPILFTLYDLIQRGILEVATQSVRPADGVIRIPFDDPTIELSSPADHLQQAQEHMRRRQFEQAIRALQHALSAFPYDQELARALEAAERSLLEALRTELCQPNRIPRMVVDPAEVHTGDWTPAQRYLLSRIDGQRSLQAIITVSPLKEVDALRAFKALIDRGIISL